MLGNVFQWVADDYGSYKGDSQADPLVKLDGAEKGVRGVETPGKAAGPFEGTFLCLAEYDVNRIRRLVTFESLYASCCGSDLGFGRLTNKIHVADLPSQIIERRAYARLVPRQMPQFALRFLPPVKYFVFVSASRSSLS